MVIAPKHVGDGKARSRYQPATGGKLRPKGWQNAPTLYAGLFEAGNVGHYMWHVPGWECFKKKWDELASQGLKLVSIDTDEEEKGSTWFLGAWLALPGADYLWRTTEWDDLRQKFEERSGQLRLVDLDIHASGGSRWYTGVWAEPPARQVIVHDLSQEDFLARWSELSNQGMRLLKAQVYPAGDSHLVTGLFEEGEGGYDLLLVSNWEEFDRRYRDHAETMQLVDFEIYDEGGARWYLGVWRETAAPHRFVAGLDWGSFVAQSSSLSSQGFRLKKAIRFAAEVEAPEPKWLDSLAATVGKQAEGFAYKVVQDGKVAASGFNLSRTPADSPAAIWTLDSRINLASVSKPVTAVALLKLLSARGIAIEEPFYRHLAGRFPQVGHGVDSVRIKDLLTMKSGLAEDDTLFFDDLWQFLTCYLKKDLVCVPGQTEVYSNTNFTILQALIEALAQKDYVAYVTSEVLVPMNIDPAIFSPIPDRESIATLSYGGRDDTRKGVYWGPIQAVAAGGWISSANELAKFLGGVRRHSVLSPEMTVTMFKEKLGWYTYDGIYGQYFYHDGLLYNNDDCPWQGLVTGILHLADGYDALLLVNSQGFDPIERMVQAFETRDVSRHAEMAARKARFSDS